MASPEPSGQKSDEHPPAERSTGAPPPRRHRRDSGPWIAAIAAIVGTLVGGLATYAGNQQLQNRQVAREEARATTSVRAIARLLMTEYQKDIKALDLMRGIGEYEPASYHRHTFVSSIGLEDRKLLAGRLSAQHWLSVADAAQEIETVAADLEAHHGQGALGQYEQETLKEARGACAAAFGALRPLAEEKSAS